MIESDAIKHTELADSGVVFVIENAIPKVPLEKPKRRDVPLVPSPLPERKPIPTTEPVPTPSRQPVITVPERPVTPKPILVP